MKQSIATEKAPKAIGPYSQAIAHNGIVYLSGQIPLDPATGQIVEGDIAAQTERVLENLKAVLEAARTTLDRLVKANVYIKDMNDFAAMNAVYAEYLAPQGVSAPARTTIEAARLPKDALVEIELIAEAGN